MSERLNKTIRIGAPSKDGLYTEYNVIRENGYKPRIYVQGIMFDDEERVGCEEIDLLEIVRDRLECKLDDINASKDVEKALKSVESALFYIDGAN